MSRQEKVYTFNEYVLGYDSGEDGSCLIISKVLNGETYVMSQLYKSDAIVVSIVLDELQKGLQEKDKEIERLNNIIKNLDKMFEYYFLGNLKYDQDTVNTIYIKYIKLKELKGDSSNE